MKDGTFARASHPNMVRSFVIFTRRESPARIVFMSMADNFCTYAAPLEGIGMSTGSGVRSPDAPSQGPPLQDSRCFAAQVTLAAQETEAPTSTSNSAEAMGGY